MLTKSLVPRDQSSHISLPSVDAYEKPRPKGSVKSYSISFPSVDAYEKPRPKGPVKSNLFPECRCL